jgi:hypothetical protein
MATYGPEFLFEGQAVGVFKDGIAPTAEGNYAYVPYRGLGHHNMQVQLKQTGAARCAYVANNKRISFTVRACPQYGVLELAAFQEVPAGAP